MKDTAISYDLVHQQQQQQHQQQHQHHHSWNQQQQQQQQRQQQHPTHTTSVYSSQSAQGSQSLTRNPIDHSQQSQHGAAHVASYHHQQLQSSAHHNSVAAAYYQQQAHLYPTYQDQQQQQQQQQQHTPTDNQHGQHHHQSASSVPVTGAPTVSAAGAVHTPVHHQQQQQTTTNTHQGSALNHAGGWSSGVGSQAAAQGHHAVVTDHSTLAYMTHAYQSHNTSVGDHRNSNGPPMSTQPIGSGAQTSSYTVDTLYNTPAAAAAAVAAYGYNNYNAAFFQTSNNGPHTQTGHPSQANMSAFWNHNQPAQQRSAHSQVVTNQASVQQRQPISSEQAANYLHDPRIYYGRPAYGQNLQNFANPQHQPQSQANPADVLHHRLTDLSQQQHQLLHHHEQQQLHHATHHQQLHHQSSLANHIQTSPIQSQQTVIGQQQQQQLPHLTLQHQQQQQTQLTASQSTTITNNSQNNRQNPQPKNALTQNQQKSTLSEVEDKAKPLGQVKEQLEQHPLRSSNTSPSQSTHLTTHQSSVLKDNYSSNTQNSKVQQPSQQQQTPISKSPVSKMNTNDAVVKNELADNNQRKPPANSLPPFQNRNIYRSQHDESNRTQHNSEQSKKQNIERDTRTAANFEMKNTSSPPPPRQQDSDQLSSLEDSLGSLSIGNASRKTTWASIASQPAKVSQPKSLKSKIAGSNSVLSSAKHLAAVSLDSSNLESKNGINPAIKSSVSAAATSLSRSSVPPPISKLPAVAASLKLDLLGEENMESRISWPAVNASINLTLDDPPLKDTSSSASNSHTNNQSNDRQKRDDVYRPRDFRESAYKDHNHNQGSNSKMVNSSYQSSYSSNRDFWNRGRESRDYRPRRDSDHDKPLDYPDDPRRDYKPNNAPRNNQFRGDEQHRDRDYNNKRAPMLDHRNEQPHRNEGFKESRFPSNRFEPRDSHHQHNNHHSFGNKHNDNHQQTQHHHYNNIRDGNSTGNPLSKQDLTLHPHLNPANLNPKTFNLEPVNARYFIIKSYSEDDIHRSIKYSIWCSTNHGNKRLDEAYRQQSAKDGPIYLFFSVNGSGHFCGMAQMTSSVDFDSSSGIWAQSKWQGEFSVKWIYVKDVPNGALRHITLENNEDKPVTNSRDTQEVPSEKGKSVLKILHQYMHTTSIFDDFLHYEKRQEEEKFKKSHTDQQQPPNRSEERERSGGARFGSRPYMNARSHNEFQGNRDRPSRFA